MTESTIWRVYEMLYPYGDYNGDLALACIAIHRELKSLCKNNIRIPLLIIGKYLGFRYNPNTMINEICNDIDTYVSDTCLRISDDNTKAKIVIGYKTGIIDPINVELRDWQDIKHVFDSHIFIEDINFNIRNKEMFYEWYLNRDEIETMEKYAVEYDDCNIDDQAADKYFDDKVINRHYKLIEKVLRLIYEGKIPVTATYDDIYFYLSHE